MKILFDEIPETGLTLEIHDASWYPEGDWQRVGPARADLHLTRRGAQVEIEGRLQFVNRCECDLCLEAYDDPHDESFRVEFEYLPPGDPYWQAEAGEHECPEDEMDVVILAEPALEIEGILEQQAILSLPVKRMCKEDCRGLCPRCGKNLNIETCACREQTVDSPFQVLAQLKRK